MDIQAENKKEFGIPKSAMAIFSVASVLFSAHAGGGSLDDDDARSDDHVQQIQP